MRSVLTHSRASRTQMVWRLERRQATRSTNQSFHICHSFVVLTFRTDVHTSACADVFELVHRSDSRILNEWKQPVTGTWVELSGTSVPLAQHRWQIRIAVRDMLEPLRV